MWLLSLLLGCTRDDDKLSASKVNSLDWCQLQWSAQKHIWNILEVILYWYEKIKGISTISEAQTNERCPSCKQNTISGSSLYVKNILNPLTPTDAIWYSYKASGGRLG